MKTLFSFFFLIAFFGRIQGQQVIEQYTPQTGSLRYGTGGNDIFPYEDRGYTLILPSRAHPVLGTIVMLDDKEVDLKDTSRSQYIHIDREANAKGLAVLYIATGIPMDLYFSPSSLLYTDTTMKQVFARYHLPNKNIFLLGAMVSGHRALKYIEYCHLGQSAFNPAITGVVLSESAIDWVRQWYECQKQVRDSLSATGYFEGNLVSYLFRDNLKTTPPEHIDAYIDFSPYSYFDTKMKKPAIYKNLAIRAYTYADIRYWFSAKGKGIYDSNYPDMSGFINEQKLAGNKRAELIVFNSDPNGSANEMRRQSGTWELVNKSELIDWMVKQMTN